MTEHDIFEDQTHYKLAQRVLICMVPLPAGAAWLIGNPMAPILMLSVGFAAAGWLGQRLRSPIHGHLVAGGLIGQAALFTAAFAGHPWQIDTHMLFFAILAVISTMHSIPALIVACGLTAVHHLGLTLALPALVYPSADLAANILRTAVHGVIVVVEGGILSLSMREAKRQRHALIQQRSEAMRLTQEADVAKREAQKAGADAQQVVGALSGGLESLASGDLTRTIETSFPPDYEGLRRDFNVTVNSLRDLIGAVAENAMEIHLRAEELSVGSLDLSQRTESQAATLEETAAALEEMTSSVRSSAEGASRVEEVVRKAHGSAEQSGQVVTDAVLAMSEIKRSSDEINQIIGVIDDIAFQTNLLALNAGVEAARAGDAGRGFAVVASEVRALAQRSAESAREIKTLIGTSTDHVENGVSLVNCAGEALTDIMTRVADVAELIGDIANGSQEQSAGLLELNNGVAQLDQVTQQNAAMVEESSAASTVLKKEAENLQSLVARFRLKRASHDADMTAVDEAIGSGDDAGSDPVKWVA